VTPADLLLTNLGVDAPADADTVIPLTEDQLSLVDGKTRLIISFPPFALADGVYELQLLPTLTDEVGNPLDGAGSGTATPAVFQGNGTNRFFKLTADYNGSGGVQIQDFATFAYWFGTAAPPAPGYVDLNSSGGINIQDFAGFSGNFGVGIAYPSEGAFTPFGQTAGDSTGGAEALESFPPSSDRDTCTRDARRSVRFAVDAPRMMVTIGHRFRARTPQRDRVDQMARPMSGSSPFVGRRPASSASVASYGVPARGAMFREGEPKLQRLPRVSTPGTLVDDELLAVLVNSRQLLA
jgi:hypothetical protein